MYAIRNKKNKEYMKLIDTYISSRCQRYEIAFSPAIEINFYMNESLGFISSILLGQSDGSSFEPELQSGINPHDLEVVNMEDLSVVSIKELLNGLDENELPNLQEP